MPSPVWPLPVDTVGVIVVGVEGAGVGDVVGVVTDPTVPELLPVVLLLLPVVVVPPVLAPVDGGVVVLPVVPGELGVIVFLFGTSVGRLSVDSTVLMIMALALVG